MPVSRDLAEDLARILTELYGDLETRLAQNIADQLARGIESPTWVQDKYEALSILRRRQETLLRQLEGPMRDRIAQALILAYYRGGVTAVEEVARWQPSLLERLAAGNKALERLSGLARRREAAIWKETAKLRSALPGIDAIQRLAFSLVSQLQGAHTPILRWSDDVYRQVVAQTALVDVLAGTKTRLRAAQVTWERLLSGGVRGFTDKAGRRWELASYVEMATRTGVAQAAVEGHMDRLQTAGIDLVIVSNAPQECKLCRPFEGKVLARSGPVGRIETENVLTGRTVTVNVVDTVRGAVGKGLMHPNCRHSLSAYLPGATEAPTRTADPQGDADRQRLRALERRLRRWKLKEAAAIDPAAKQALGKKVRGVQAEIREHVKTTTAKRQPQREQTGQARLLPVGAFPAVVPAGRGDHIEGMLPRGRAPREGVAQ